jgi:hypothetical protein
VKGDLGSTSGEEVSECSWLESVLWAGIENYIIIIKTLTVYFIGFATMFPVV